MDLLMYTLISQFETIYLIISKLKKPLSGISICITHMFYLFCFYLFLFLIPSVFFNLCVTPICISNKRDIMMYGCDSSNFVHNFARNLCLLTLYFFKNAFVIARKRCYFTCVAKYMYDIRTCYY